jgi:hypothetical protein
MKRTVLISIFLLFAISIQAKKVELQTAQNVGLAYYYEHVNQFVPVELKALNVTSVYTEYQNSLPVFYVFNINNNGFVIVSADDIATPVLGYSYESDFKANSVSPNLQYWLSGVKKTIVDAITNNFSATSDINNSWDYYKSRTADNLNINKEKVVAPLLTCTWDQGKYYNQYCPVATGGPDGRALVGCVAVAMAQVMYYYRFPATGLGSHGGINFGTTTYNWDNMLDNLGNYNDGVATIQYHAGRAVDMSYAADGSGANTTDCPSALKNYFRYNSTCAYGSKYLYNTTTWNNLLKSNLDARHPLIYSGTDPANGGHAWNCDGYDASNNFHMNWGWSGYANGYFAIDNLTAGGFSFTNYIGVVYNFFPPTTSYPNNCTGTKTINYIAGTIEDGSGSADYQNNQDCLWLIDPTETVTKITLSFINLSTEATNDIVTVYDGNSTSSPVLGTYSGSTLPNDITSTGPQMLVRFQTNGTSVANGWKASYRSSFPSYCSGITTLTAETGTINDGSATDNYSYNHLCRWTISPANAIAITLSFSAFNLATNDSLRIYDQITSAKVAAYSGASIPATETYNTSKLLLMFKTDGYLNSQGFDAAYTSTLSGMEENNGLNQFLVFPNPANTTLNIQFISENNETLKIQLTSITGQTVYDEILNNFSGSFNKSISTTSFSKGVYLLRIIGEKQAVHEKIIIE